MELNDSTTKGSREPATPSSSHSGSQEEGRFPAGTVLAARYRVSGLLGRGGMGEVYRAYDLILNQSVALKFLPQHFNAASLERFRNEVRIARQVSHPNVCRVYDIGVADGMHFLSMEYLDGEDLASLLRRIGRLPQDKAVEFTRKLCAGLHAAHERGVLHRDLKPGNIMIDGRGQLRITDFGLAAIAEEVALADIRSGTPAYMSPEQKAGKEVTTRSDIYSLGLVVYEMFTGKHRTGSSSSMSDIVKDVDPAVERVVNRCLEEDPKRRPVTALNVAMALPGGDPIAAALAQGETPLPEMVAASQEKEGLSVRTAVLCFAAVVLAVVVTGAWLSSRQLSGLASLATPPDALAFQARDMLKRFGYVEAPMDKAYGFDCCRVGNLVFVNRMDTVRRAELLQSHQPPVIRFWYRERQTGYFRPDLSVTLFTGVVSYDSPSNDAGMIRVALDPAGRLMELEARPEGEFAAASSGPMNWDAVFLAAGLDKERFTAAQPQAVPSLAFDERSAWTGTYSERIPQTIRIEAASWRGRPVYWSIVGEWDTAGPAVAGRAWFAAFGSVILLLLMGGAILAARSNLRSGRGDRKGAARVAGAFFLLAMFAWVLKAEHTPTNWEMPMLLSALSTFASMSGLLWLAYIAIEPYARRHWPDALISWNRLQSGHFRDSLVASHILVGVTGRYLANMAVVVVLGPSPRSPAFVNGFLDGPGSAIAFLLGSPAVALAVTLAFLMGVVVSRMLIPRVWLADIVTSALIGVVASSAALPGGIVLSIVANGILLYVTLWVFRRFGLLAVLAWQLAFVSQGLAPLMLTEWYAGWALVAHGIPVALAAYALWVIVSSQRQPVEA